MLTVAVLADIEEGWCTAELTETDGFWGMAIRFLLLDSVGPIQ